MNDTVDSALELLDRLPRPEAAWFHDPEGIHGVGHTQRVMIHASRICQAEGVDGDVLEAVVRAALWHDVGRFHNGVDYNHGARSVGKVIGLGLHEAIERPARDIAFLAAEYHSQDDEWGERAATWLPDPAAAVAAYWVLKDADALDRVRLGGPREVDPRQLRRAWSRGQIELAWELYRGWRTEN